MKIGMMIAIATILGGCVASASAQHSRTSWCNASRITDDGALLDVEEIQPVQASHWEQSLERLGNNRLINVSAAESSLLAGIGPAPNGVHSYLVRGSAFVPANASRDTIYRSAQERHRFVTSATADGQLVVLSVVTSHVPLTVENVPMIVRTSRTLVDAHLGCWGMS